MSPTKKPTAKSGFKGVRFWPSGRFAAELQHDGMRYWLSTFKTADLAARAYDVVGWKLGIPPEELNFKDMDNLQDAIFVAPPTKKMKTRPLRSQQQPTVWESDEEAVARFARENPKLV
ncbi:unnamed protein product [Alopecurus aequalis]